ncbi:nuclear transport factor 2 family protein [Nocardia jinanensis]|uniref:Polyketide cyclase n=1 Tax=Nocardia jinanensis TaxID=382504 RepID=A0A917RMY2_9NOCA|nr:nuclear transport factor 2 family protein [Nocardia jinanensis]GGL15399.1 polyketide cyclase [Nocardia jinanensis]
MAATDTPSAVAAWHRLVAEPDTARLRDLLAPEVVFRSPAVHTPQVGRDRAFAYLWAALQVLGPTLTYGHQWFDDDSAVLRFSATVDELVVDGVDLIRWDTDGRLTEFTVMIRPFKALQAVIAAMGAELTRQQ